MDAVWCLRCLANYKIMEVDEEIELVLRHSDLKHPPEHYLITPIKH